MCTYTLLVHHMLIPSEDLIKKLKKYFSLLLFLNVLIFSMGQSEIDFRLDTEILSVSEKYLEF